MLSSIQSMYIYTCLLELSPEEIFFAIRALCSSLMTKINWGLGFSDEVKTESLKCINGKYIVILLANFSFSNVNWSK